MTTAWQYVGPWQPILYFWEGGWLGIGHATGVVPEHAHHAVQVSIGLDGPVRFRAPDEEWIECDIGVIRPNAPHLFDGCGRALAMLFLEPESREGRWLRDSLREPIAGLPRARVAAQLPALLAFREERPGAEAASRLILDVVGALAAGSPPQRRMDERIARALAYIRGHDDGRLSLEVVAREVFLSPSRLAHLFTDEVGLPFRRYLLWRKLSRAMQAFGRGATLSAAAHAAGFADSAHLTRTWHQMFGMPPSLMMAMAEFHEIPAPFELLV